MTSTPTTWSETDLANDAAIATANFRLDRLGATTWPAHYQEARRKFELLFEQLGDLDPQHITDATLLKAWRSRLSLTVSLKSRHYAHFFILHVRNDGCERTL